MKTCCAKTVTIAIRKLAKHATKCDVHLQSHAAYAIMGCCGVLERMLPPKPRKSTGKTLLKHAGKIKGIGTKEDHGLRTKPRKKAKGKKA